MKPNPTPIELAEAKRQVELRQIELENMRRDLDRKTELRNRDFVTQEELELAKRRYDQAAVQVQMARERVDLLETGRVRINDRDIEAVIRSP
ncbi:MAG: efflux RND transporter periplasmic adaptor subunit, partial [Gemmatimonadota bacterium]